MMNGAYIVEGKEQIGKASEKIKPHVLIFIY